MGLKDSLKQDLTEAMRARDELLLSTIRLCLSAITNEEVSGKEARVLTEPEVIQVLSREAKKRRESAQAFADAGRPDRADFLRGRAGCRNQQECPGCDRPSGEKRPDRFRRCGTGTEEHRDFQQRGLGDRGLVLAFGHQGAQVGGARLLGGRGLELVQCLLGQGQLVAVDVDAGAGHQR